MVSICLKDVTLEFPVYNANRASLRHKLLNVTSGGRISSGINDITMVRALDKANLVISPGDRVGLLGHNGAGKTSLLRCIAGIYTPTSGSISVKGSLSIILEIASGAEMELSGFDNIRRLLYLHGLKPTNVPQVAKEVAEFAELGDFIYLPMRTYSSGMMMRLMFAIATAITPDILLIDEFFGVGDEDFQTKADARIRSNINKSAILVFASHNKELLKKMCNRFIMLSAGKLEEVNL